MPYCKGFAQKKFIYIKKSIPQKKKAPEEFQSEKNYPGKKSYPIGSSGWISIVHAFKRQSPLFQYSTCEKMANKRIHPGNLLTYLLYFLRFQSSFPG